MTERDPGLQHPSEDSLLDVALRQVDLPTRHDVGSHLVICPRCRVAYDELAGAVELVLPAIPRAAPPPDFEQAVLTRLDERRAGSDPASEGAGNDRARARSRRRRWLAPLAAGLVGLAGGAGLAAVVLDDPSNPPGQTAAVTTAIVTEDGERVGDVTRTIADGDPALVVSLAHGPEGAIYTCRLVLADGSTLDVGQWMLREDDVNSWVVADPGARRIELISKSGRVWSSADL